MMQAILQIDKKAIVPLIQLITLTYPGEWDESDRAWHRDLEVWGKRWTDRYKSSFFVWKLEFQKRGAPHFHLMVFNAPPISEVTKRWVSRSWYEVVGSGDSKHLKAGTRCETVRSWAGVRSYCSKYLGKVGEAEQPEYVGRYWGIVNRGEMPREILVQHIDRAAFMKLRRAFRALLGKTYGYYRPGGSMSGCWVAVESENAVRLLHYIMQRESGGAELSLIGLEDPPAGRVSGSYLA